MHVFLKKVKIFFEMNLIEELKYFKKYSIEIKLLSNEKFIIPEYKIDLLNKSKKLINSIEHINSIIEIKKSKVKLSKDKKNVDKEISKGKEKKKN